MTLNTGEDYPIELQNQDNQDLYKANLVAIEALEKQMPARIERSNTRAYGYCSECGKVFWDKWENEYCENCGQKLDWVEVENE